MSMDLFTRRMQRIGSSSDWTRKTLEFVPAMVLALLMAVFTFVPVASAAVPGLQRITSPVTSGSFPTQSAVATCPAGSKVIGTGGEVNGPLGRTILRRIIPNSTLTSVTATGAEINGGTTNTWTVTAFAICANATAVPDVQLMQLDSAFDSKATKSANINCPTGKKLLGSGGALFGQGTDRVVLFTASPNGARTGAVVVGTELDSGTAESWNVRTYAICASALPGYQQVNANGQQASRAAQDATVTMPRGTKVLGAGGTVNGQTGRLALTAIIPAADLLSVTAKGMEVGSGLTTNWSVGAYANGATP